MNSTLEALVLAAEQRLRQTNPSLETRAVLRLNVVEAKALKLFLNNLVGPALVENACTSDDPTHRELSHRHALQAAAIANKLDDAMDEVVERLTRHRDQLATEAPQSRQEAA